MRFFIQSVDHASVTVDKQTEKISRGILIYVAISREDLDNYENQIEKFTEKLIKAKLLKSDNDTINSSLEDINGEILLISNFTLYGENKKGNKINFSKSAKFDEAQNIYNQLETKLKRNFPTVKSGEFGGMMTVESSNSGPINYVWDL